jgi:hypothetical protein
MNGASCSHLLNRSSVREVVDVRVDVVERVDNERMVTGVLDGRCDNARE